MRAPLLLVMVVLLAGCTAAPSAAFRDEVVVTVTDEPGGPPVAGASVRAVVPGWWWSYSQEAVTDADGRASFRPPDGVTFHVDAEGFAPGVFRENALGSPVSLALYRASLVVVMEGTLTGGDASAPNGALQNGWQAQQVAFGRNAEAREGYAQRILTLNATLTWNNTLLGGAGDLALALGQGPEDPDVWQDEEAQLELGAHEERVRLLTGQLDAAGWRGASELYAGAAPGTAYASATGIAYRIVLEAQFGLPRESPGAVIGAILALAGAALLARRTRG